MPRLPALAFAALTVFAAPASAAASSVEIVLLPDAGVVGDEVRLGDVARITTGDLDQLRRLAALSLGPAPQSGDRLQLTRGDIERWIEGRLGLPSTTLQWQGSTAAEVRRAGGEVSGERVAHVARGALEAWLRERSARVDLDMAGSVRDIAVPPGPLALRPRVPASDGAPARRAVVWVEVWVQQQFVRAVPVAFEVTAHAQGWTPTAGQVEAKSAAPTMLAPPEVRRKQLVSGAAERHAVPVQGHGAVSAASPAPGVAGGTHWPVTRGSWVALRSRSGLIELESRVEALQNGHVGQTVQIRRADAAGPVLARVIAPGRVEVVQ